MTAPICITGIGAVSPLGVGADTLHEEWARSTSGIRNGIGLCEAFDPTEHLSKKEVRRTDRFSQLALVACEEAMTQAGWDEKGLPFEPLRVGCFVGTAGAGSTSTERLFEDFKNRGPHMLPPLGVAMAMGNAASVIIQMRYGLKGESYAVVSACASGSQAIGNGLRLLRTGELDAVVVGGTDASTSPVTQAAFGVTGATSQVGISRPFDRRRDGFVLGEAAGVMLLETEQAAAGRGARVLGRIMGYGASSDAFHLTAPDPAGDGAAYALQTALTDAAIEPDDVDYINAHGTSTPLNDRSETEALKRVFGSAVYDIPVSSLKSAIGHTLGAAGAVEAIACLQALRYGIAPPTLGLEQPDDDLDLNYVPLVAQEIPPRKDKGSFIGVTNSFGFGGHNSVVVMRADDRPPMR